MIGEEAMCSVTYLQCDLLECLSGIHKISALLKCVFCGHHGQASRYGAMVVVIFWYMEEPMVFLEHVPAT